MTDQTPPLTPEHPPFDGSPACPMCPQALRNLYAVAHNLAGGSRDTTIEDLRRAVTSAQPYVDAHFANSMHALGRVQR